MTETITITESGEYDLSNIRVEKLIIKGNGVTIKNIKMTNLTEKCVQILGDNVTLSNCSFIGNEKCSQMIIIKGQWCIIDNCLFEKMNEKGCLISVIVYKNKTNNCLISNNNFRDMKEGDSNGWEVIRVGDSKSSLYDTKTIIFNNVFSNCNREIELISIKSCAVQVIFNKLFDCKSGICLRHGRRNKVMFNYINGNHTKGNCGIRICGKEHTISNNVIEGIVNRDNPFRTAISIMNGEKDNKLNGYEPVKSCFISNNDILSCDVAFSIGVNNKRKDQVLPNRVSIEGNRIVKCLDMINDNEKCGGMENSYIGLNEIIDKDIKLEIPKSFDIDEMKFNEVWEFSNNKKDFVILDDEEKPKKKDKEQKKKEVDNDFEELIEMIQKLKDDALSNCNKCDGYLEDMNHNKEKYEKIIKTLEEELHTYKERYKRISDMLIQEMK